VQFEPGPKGPLKTSGLFWQTIELLAKPLSSPNQDHPQITPIAQIFFRTIEVHTLLSKKSVNNPKYSCFLSARMLMRSLW
jgi:hypothetical protein